MKIPFARQKKHSAGVLAVPLARRDEIHGTDRLDDKWQREERGNEKQCVWKWGLCSTVSFFPSVFSERGRKVTSEGTFYFHLIRSGKKKNKLLYRSFAE